MFKTILYNEFIKGRTAFDWLFLLFGLLLQVITYAISNDVFLSFLSGTLGVFAVVLCSQKKISSYLFGILQLITYVILCFKQHFYGEIAENGFYLITMIIGISLWLRNYSNSEVKSRQLSKKGWGVVGTTFLIGSIYLGLILKETSDTQPFMDAFSTVPAIIAQILMVSRYKEQWVMWLVVDILTGILWIKAGNWCMVSQYMFWILNCLYGFVKWSKN